MKFSSAHKIKCANIVYRLDERRELLWPKIAMSLYTLHLKIYELCIVMNSWDLVLCLTEPGCSKLTTSLVNVPLKFQTLKYLKYSNIFCGKNVRSFCSSFFSIKNISVFGNKVVKHLMS